MTSFCETNVSAEQKPAITTIFNMVVRHPSHQTGSSSLSSFSISSYLDIETLLGICHLFNLGNVYKPVLLPQCIEK